MDLGHGARDAPQLLLLDREPGRCRGLLPPCFLPAPACIMRRHGILRQRPARPRHRRRRRHRPRDRAHLSRARGARAHLRRRRQGAGRRQKSYPQSRRPSPTSPTVPRSSAVRQALKKSSAGSTCWSTTPASPGRPAKVEDISPEDWDRCIAIDLNGMFYCTRKAMPLIKAAGGGSIINLSSHRRPLRLPHAHALRGGEVGGGRLHQSLAVEAGPDKVRVNCIQPGIVEGERIDRVIAAKAQGARRLAEEVLDQNGRRRQPADRPSPRRTSPTWRSSSPPRRAATSPARRSPSAAARATWSDGVRPVHLSCRIDPSSEEHMAAAQGKVIITCAVTGVDPHADACRRTCRSRRRRSPRRRSARRKAGAAIVHLHARNPEGRQPDAGSRRCSAQFLPQDQGGAATW